MNEYAKVICLLMGLSYDLVSDLIINKKDRYSVMCNSHGTMYDVVDLLEKETRHSFYEQREAEKFCHRCNAEHRLTLE
jgi:hypothetical protein